jgi:CheY-like chemotaxis protein
VLVVDDNLASRLLPGFILKAFDSHIQVFECENGHAALDLLSSQHITHVLLDISLPDLDGIQVAKQIRAIPTLKHVKLIAYTADVNSVLNYRMKSNGFDGVLLKPPCREDLLKALGVFP